MSFAGPSSGIARQRPHGHPQVCFSVEPRPARRLLTWYERRKEQSRHSPGHVATFVVPHAVTAPRQRDGLEPPTVARVPSIHPLPFDLRLLRQGGYCGSASTQLSFISM